VEFPGQRYCQGLAARGFDPDENEPQFAGFASQLVEKNSLADSAEPGQDPRSFPLPGLRCLVEPGAEFVEELPSAGKNRWDPSGAGLERVRYKIHN